MNKHAHLALILTALPLAAQVTGKRQLPTPRIPPPPRPPICYPRPAFHQAGCTGRQGTLELKNGGSRLLNDVCILNGSARVEFYLRGIRLRLTDGSLAEIPFDAIETVRFTDLSPTIPLNGGGNGAFVGVEIDSYGPLDGDLSRYLSLTAKVLITRPDSTWDPFVMWGRDPELAGSERGVRFSELKSVTFLPSRQPRSAHVTLLRA